MKKSELVFMAVAMVLVLLICAFVVGKDVVIKQDDTYNISGDISMKNDSTVDKIDIAINTDDGDEKIKWTDLEEKEYSLTDSITINASGIYNLTGIISDGQVRINAKNGNVKLVLNNLCVINNSGPAIFVEDADDVIIELASGSENYLEDGSTYTGYETDEVGTIYSHSDLTFQGAGTLEVKSNYEDAIVGKDDLKIISGTYIINSMDDAIRGKDSVYIKDGIFTINSKGDGIKSTNDTELEKGFIKIENGDFSIISELDGVNAQTKLLIENGIFNITTGGGSKVTTPNFKLETWERKDRINHDRLETNQTTIEVPSAKGIKAGDNIVINNGTFILNTSDDAIHSNTNIGIRDGSINIETGDDGIHADSELIIDGGTINITKSYEGVEAAKISLNGGNINIISFDDGINAASGKDLSTPDRSFNHSNSNTLYINGGNITVNAGGDGIDVNGTAYMYGGNVIVYGPSNSGNGALDYDRAFEVNGGTLLAGGASGMSLGVSETSKIYNLNIAFSSNYGESDYIKIVDNTVGKEIVSYKSDKDYSSLIIASPELENGKTYSLYINDTEYDKFTISSITTFIGNFKEPMNVPMGGAPDKDRNNKFKRDFSGDGKEINRKYDNIGRGI